MVVEVVEVTVLVVSVLEVVEVTVLVLSVLEVDVEVLVLVLSVLEVDVEVLVLVEVELLEVDVEVLVLELEVLEVELELVEVVVTCVPQACRKCEPYTAQPLQNAEVSLQEPTSTITSTVSSIASLPPRLCVGSLMVPKSGPSEAMSMSPTPRLKLVDGLQLTSPSLWLVTKLRPQLSTGDVHVSTPKQDEQ